MIWFDGENIEKSWNFIISMKDKLSMLKKQIEESEVNGIGNKNKKH